MMKKNVMIIDIDGVICDYRTGLLYWIRQSWPALATKANEQLKVSDTWIDHRTMGVPYREWLSVLEMFRMSGGKRSLPLFEGAKDLITWCQYMNYEIVLLTSRPIDIYSNIYRDTVEFLKDNDIHHHLLLWSKSKAEIVHKLRLTDKVVWAIDDELKHIEEYTALGIPTIWINLYNVPFTRDNTVTTLRDALRLMKGVEHEKQS